MSEMIIRKLKRADDGGVAITPSTKPSKWRTDFKAKSRYRSKWEPKSKFKMSDKHAYCRILYQEVMKDVKKHVPKEIIKEAWVIRTGGPGHYEFQIPSEKFYWYGQADCTFSAKAEGWMVYMREKGIITDDDIGAEASKKRAQVKCPYCGSDNVEKQGGRFVDGWTDTYYCLDCYKMFEPKKSKKKVQSYNQLKHGQGRNDQDFFDDIADSGADYHYPREDEAIEKMYEAEMFEKWYQENKAKYPGKNEMEVRTIWNELGKPDVPKSLIEEEEDTFIPNASFNQIKAFTERDIQTPYSSNPDVKHLTSQEYVAPSKEAQAYTCLMAKGEELCRQEFGDNIIDRIVDRIATPASKKTGQVIHPFIYNEIRDMLRQGDSYEKVAAYLKKKLKGWELTKDEYNAMKEIAMKKKSFNELKKHAQTGDSQDNTFSEQEDYDFFIRVETKEGDEIRRLGFYDEAEAETKYEALQEEYDLGDTVVTLYGPESKEDEFGYMNYRKTTGTIKRNDSYNKLTKRAGTWAFPFKVEDATALAAIVKALASKGDKKVNHSALEKKMWNIYGNDSTFDELININESGELTGLTAAMQIVSDIKGHLDDYDSGELEFSEEVEPKARKILDEMIMSVGASKKAAVWDYGDYSDEQLIKEYDRLSDDPDPETKMSDQWRELLDEMDKRGVEASKKTAKKFEIEFIKDGQPDTKIIDADNRDEAKEKFEKEFKEAKIKGIAEIWSSKKTAQKKWHVYNKDGQIIHGPHDTEKEANDYLYNLKKKHPGEETDTLYYAEEKESSKKIAQDDEEEEEPKPEDEDAVPEDMEPMMEEFPEEGLEEVQEEPEIPMTPNIINIIQPMDMQLLTRLEKDRQRAIESGDLSTKRYIDKEIDVILEKYITPEPVGEMSPSSFVARRMQGHFALQRDMLPMLQRASAAVRRIQKLFPVSLSNISFAGIHTNEYDLEPKEGWVEWVLSVRKVGSMQPGKRGIIRVAVHGDQIEVVPVIWDIFGRRYNLDQDGIEVFLGTKFGDDMKNLEKKYLEEERAYRKKIDKGELEPNVIGIGTKPQKPTGRGVSAPKTNIP